MKYRVRTTPRAESDAVAIYSWIAEHEGQPDNASRWLDGLQEAIESLSTQPRRCPLAPESRSFADEIRQLLYHRHRILFLIEHDAVFVLHIRHSSRLAARGADFE